MSRRPAKRRKTAADRRMEGEKRSGAMKFFVAVAIIIVFSTFYFYVRQSHKELDAKTQCPATPSSITVLLVDVTDPMNPPQQRDFQNQLTRLKNSIPRYGQLIVTRIGANSSDLLQPIIVICNPGTSSDTNEMIGNPAKLQKRWEEDFCAPLLKEFETIGRESGAEDQSPIIESIQSVALTEFQKPGVEDISKKLIVASDLLQHTHTLSFYTELPDPNDLIKSKVFRRIRTDLRGIEVELWQIQRSSKTQPRALAQLWEQIIVAQNGSVSRVYNVSG